jgi:hypothetical protein
VTDSPESLHPILKLAIEVYEGLSDEDIAEIESIALERGADSRPEALHYRGLQEQEARETTKGQVSASSVFSVSKE